MSRTITIDPVTRVEGHAKVDIEIDDQENVRAATLHVLEFRGFERFVQGMQVELMPTLLTRICGTCPHAHHLAAAKMVDRVFSVTPPRAAVLQRELINAGSFIHSHAIHFFALAGPDLFLGLGAPPAKRNIIGLLEVAPELAKKALRLRSIGQKIAEIVGGRGTHPVTAVAGGMAAPLTVAARDALKALAAEGLELAEFAVRAGREALVKSRALLQLLPMPVHFMGTVQGGALDLYDGVLRVVRPDGSRALEFPATDYRKYLYEEAVTYSYTKQLFFRDPAGPSVSYQVGPLARLNCAERIDTHMANELLAEFKQTWGAPCVEAVVANYARLIELFHAAEKAVEILNDDEILSANVRTPISATPKPAIAHVEAPRGVLIHDFDVDAQGIVRACNLIVATQHNISSINSGIKALAGKYLKKPEAELLNGVEFAIRCFDPCLSCSTHQVGSMPLDVSIVQDGHVVRHATR